MSLFPKKVECFFKCHGEFTMKYLLKDEAVLDLTAAAAHRTYMIS